jgi:hypothetical protein
VGGVCESIDRRPVARHPLCLAGGEADRKLVRPVVACARHGDPQRIGAEPDELGIVAGAKRAPGAAEVERLEEVRLAGRIRSVHDRQSGADVELGALIRAKVAKRKALDTHCRSRVEPDRHDEVGEAASVR